MFDVTALLPMLALILHNEAMPIAIGSSSGWLTFAGMIMRPRATSSRTKVGSRRSRRATYSISSVITPARAKCICEKFWSPACAARSRRRASHSARGCSTAVVVATAPFPWLVMMMLPSGRNGRKHHHDEPRERSSCYHYGCAAAPRGVAGAAARAGGAGGRPEFFADALCARGRDYGRDGI